MIHQHPKQFSFPLVRKRKTSIRRIIVHHTGGTGDADRVRRTLVRRHLSVHYVVERTGRIVQLADDSLVTFHAGKANEGSIGIECQARGFLGGRKKLAGEIFYADEVHGRKRGDWIAFPEAQRAALVELVATLCDAHDVPPQVPLMGDWTVLRGVLPNWQSYQGVLAHFHVSSRKLDAPPREMDYIAQALGGFMEV